MRSRDIHRSGFGLKLAAGLVLLFLNFPISVIILYAFTTEEASFRFPPPGLTLDWFPALFSRTDFWDAFGLSLQVAITATIIAIILGSLVSLALYRTSFFGRDTLSLFVILPIALPGIVSGIALRSAIGVLDIPFSTWTIIIGHATFCVVTVYNNVVARLRRMQQSQVEASMDLGANPLQTFRYVIFPNMATALLAGAFLAFALSFDEIIVTTFTAGQQDTLPIWIFSQLTRPRDRPVTNVAAVFVISITLIPILLAYRYTRNVSET